MPKESGERMEKRETPGSDASSDRRKGGGTAPEKKRKAITGDNDFLSPLSGAGEGGERLR